MNKSAMPLKMDWHKPIQRLKEKAPLIQVLLGPRQVGKTTLVQQMMVAHPQLKWHYVSGDGVASSQWILEQWQKAQLSKSILVVDEIQKIPQWSEVIKAQWDLSSGGKSPLMKCLLLGSSSLNLQKGLHESLTGRFEVLQQYHWEFLQSQKLSKMSLDQYLIYGGYPGSYKFIKNPQRWSAYLRSSIVETVIGKDILTQAKVKSPALFRQCFELITSYPAQYISYNKLLGQLQDKGNIDLIKYYIELFEAAFLIKAIHKYSKNEISKKQSSPKIITLAPSLSTYSRLDRLNPEFLGRVFESLVGAQLVKTGLPIFYWQQGDYEVDYIIEYRNQVIAIEVKSGRSRKAKSLSVFTEKHPKTKIIFIDKDNYTQFEKNPVQFIEKLI